MKWTPVTEAAPIYGINVAQIEVPGNLSSFDDKYQLHTGVLDTLRRYEAGIGSDADFQ